MGVGHPWTGMPARSHAHRKQGEAPRALKDPQVKACPSTGHRGQPKPGLRKSKLHDAAAKWGSSRFPRLAGQQPLPLQHDKRRPFPEEPETELNANIAMISRCSYPESRHCS